MPPVRRPTQKPWNKQIVWPRDKKQDGVHSWRRWKDLFTNKGPDMWVTPQRSTGVHRPVWSGWNQASRDNLGYYWRNDNHGSAPRAFRPEWQRYDFQKRRYRMADGNTWSDVKWCRTGRVPLYFRDAYRNEWVNPDYWDGPDNPFAWDNDTPYWDWHHDTIHYPLFDNDQ